MKRNNPEAPDNAAVCVARFLGLVKFFMTEGKINDGLLDAAIVTNPRASSDLFEGVVGDYQKNNPGHPHVAELVSEMTILREEQQRYPDCALAIEHYIRSHPLTVKRREERTKTFANKLDANIGSFAEFTQGGGSSANQGRKK